MGKKKRGRKGIGKEERGDESRGGEIWGVWKVLELVRKNKEVFVFIVFVVSLWKKNIDIRGNLFG